MTLQTMKTAAPKRLTSAKQSWQQRQNDGVNKKARAAKTTMAMAAKPQWQWQQKQQR